MPISREVSTKVIESLVSDGKLEEILLSILNIQKIRGEQAEIVQPVYLFVEGLIEIYWFYTLGNEQTGSEIEQLFRISYGLQPSKNPDAVNKVPLLYSAVSKVFREKRIDVQRAMESS